jgi:hypothetical protein
MYYDDAELVWNSGATTTSVLSPLFSQFLGPLNGATSGFIGNFNAGSFLGDSAISSPLSLAHIAFDVVSPTLDGSPDVWFDTASSGMYGFTIDNTFVQMSDMQVTGLNPDVYSIVPEPVSSILFILGGATMGFRRFRKTIAN